MSLDDQKDLSRRAILLWASDNTDTAEDIVAQSYINHQEPYAKGGVGDLSLEAWKDLVSGYHSAFSNSQVRILTEIAEDALVAIRWEITATHTGEYMDLAPTNKEVTWTGVSIDRFENGKIVESWVDWDKYRLFQGLGLVK